eukprot:gene17773-biopygen10703
MAARTGACDHSPRVAAASAAKPRAAAASAAKPTAPAAAVSEAMRCAAAAISAAPLPSPAATAVTPAARRAPTSACHESTHAAASDDPAAVSGGGPRLGPRTRSGIACSPPALPRAAQCGLARSATEAPPATKRQQHHWRQRQRGGRQQQRRQLERRWQRSSAHRQAHPRLLRWRLPIMMRGTRSPAPPTYTCHRTMMRAIAVAVLTQFRTPHPGFATSHARRFGTAHVCIVATSQPRNYNPPSALAAPMRTKVVDSLGI